MRRSSAVNSRMVARSAGVAQSTVSKIANNSPHVSEATRTRVLRVACDLHYSLTPRNGIRTIAVIIPSRLASSYASAMLAEVIRELLKRKYRPEILPDNSLDLLNERAVDGGIAISWKPGLTRAWKQRLPLPLIRINGASACLQNCHSVYFDAEPSLRLAFQHLWQLGHRRFGFCFFNTRAHELSNVARRYAAFVKVMQERGIARPESFCRFGCLEATAESLAATLREWTGLGVTALFFSNGSGTGKMLRALQLAKLSVPADLSLVGWEEPGLSEFTEPPLCTLYPDPKIAVPLAIGLLEKLLHHTGGVQDLAIPYRWMPRASIGWAPTMP